MPYEDPSLNQQASFASSNPAVETPSSAPSDTPASTSSWNPLGAATALIGKGADIAERESGANTNQSGSQTTYTDPGLAGPQTLQDFQNLPTSYEAAKQGLSQAAQIQQQAVPAFQKAQNVNNDLIQRNLDLANQVKANAASISGGLQQAQTDMDNYAITAKTNPTQETWDKFFGDHPVMSSIAMILGGIGGGASGNNAVLSVLDRAVQGAKEQKADELNGYLQDALGRRANAATTLNNSQTQAIASNLASSWVNAGTKAALDYVQGQINSQTAVQQAAVAKNKLDQQQFQNDLGLTALLKNPTVLYDKNNSTALGQAARGGVAALTNNTNSTQARAAARAAAQRQGIKLPEEQVKSEKTTPKVESVPPSSSRDPFMDAFIQLQPGAK